MNGKDLRNKIKALRLELDFCEEFYSREIKNNDKYDDIVDYFEDHRFDDSFGEIPYGEADYINYMFEDPYYPAKIMKYGDNYILYISESDDLFCGSLEKLNEYCKECLFYNTLSNNNISINNDTYKMIKDLADEKYDGKIYDGYDSNDLDNDIYDMYYQKQNKNKSR